MVSRLSRTHTRVALSLGILVVAGALIASMLAFTHRAAAAGLQVPAVPLRALSSDPYMNFATEHRTQVEPGSFAYGATIVTAFQSGRGYTAGASNIGWATSTDNGKSWKNGFLSGITVNANGPYRRASDAVVAYDAAHKTWLITSLGVPFSGGYDVLVNHSTDGGLTWDAASHIATSGPSNSLDKDWSVCDNTFKSPFYGHCYAEWDDANNNGKILMSTSTDGGKTWSAPNGPSNQTFSGIGGQPVVQPNGTVIVPIYGADLQTGAASIYAYSSKDGGATWTAPVLAAAVAGHDSTSDYRGGILPSATVDGAGKVYVVWSDCSFISGCTADDIVLITSTNGTTWSSVQRLPFDAVDSGVDHFTAAITADPATAGTKAHLAVTFYQFTNTNCFVYNCQLEARYASSVNGGGTWSATQQLGPTLRLAWLADTSEGFMTGDYVAISISGHHAFPFIASANLPSATNLAEATYTVAGQGLALTGGSLWARSPRRTLPVAPSGKAQPVLPPSN